jgi:hypothetical protein
VFEKDREKNSETKKKETEVRRKSDVHEDL